MLGAVLLTGGMGSSTAGEQKLGADTIRVLLLEGSIGRFGAGTIVAGALVLLVSLFVPDRSK